MNNVTLMGRLARDPDVRYNNENMAIARYTLAVDRRGKKQEADFISCVAFGKSGEFIEKYCKKGTKLVVRGRIQTGSYTNKDGNKVYTTDVVTEDHEFAESKANSAGSTQGGNSYQSAPNEGGFMNIPDGIDEELPFN